MKKLIFSLTLAFGLLSSAVAQEAYPCHTDEKHKEFLESLTPTERTQYEQERAVYEQEIQQFIAENPQLLVSNQNRGTISYTIPVVFHIIHGDGPENISEEQVLNALNHMNEDFQKSNPNWQNVVSEFLPLVADVEVEFKLAKKDNNGNCTNGITRTYAPSVTDGGSGQARISAVQNAHGNWPGNKYLNIFVAKTIGGAAGYTTYPSDWASTSMGNGIHVLHNYVGSIGTAGSHGAHTLTHEVGHWLNLPHTWGSSNEPGIPSNCGMDDGVADTPNTMGWTSCNLQGRTCDETLDNVENFMEYSYCSKMFTNGQKARMHAALAVSSTGRRNVVSAANLIATGVNLPDVLCAADFSAQYREICVGETVEFKDMSYNLVTSHNWSFEGGNPSTSTASSPTVTYNTPGVYKVTLVASDGSSTVTETKNAYIRVLDAPASLPLIESFEDYTSMNSQNFWSVENPGNNAKFEITTDAAYSGSKSIKLANFGQQAGNRDAFISQPLDLSAIDNDTKATLSFRFSYRKRNSDNNEILKIFLSNTCGKTWQQRRTFIGNSLGSITSSTSWTPSSVDDWVTVHVTNVTSQYWVDNLRVKFEFESDGGNNLYIDDINIYSGEPNDNPLSIQENELIQNFSVYPNPADDIANVTFSSIGSQSVNIDIVNTMGQVVQSNIVQAANGENMAVLSTENINAGIYLIKISSGANQQIQRLVIK